MIVTVGDRVRREFSGKIYRVRRITDGWILLEEEGKSHQILTGKNNVELSFKKVREKDESEGETSLMFAS